MATQSFLDMIEEFGTGLGVPKVDVDKLIEVRRRNIDALGRSALVATENSRDIAELAMKTTSDATAIVRERLRESLSELRNSVSLAGSEMPKKT